MQGQRAVDFELVDGVIRARSKGGGRPLPAPAQGDGHAPRSPATPWGDLDRYFDERALAETRREMGRMAETMRVSAEIRDMTEAIMFVPPAARTVTGTSGQFGPPPLAGQGRPPADGAAARNGHAGGGPIRGSAAPRPGTPRP